jgi:sulfur carrier protein ThiS
MKVFISGYLAELAGQTEFDFELMSARPLNVFFNDFLFDAYPALKLRVINEEGHLRRHVAVFVDGAQVRHERFATTNVMPSGEVHVFPAVSGG